MEQVSKYGVSKSNKCAVDLVETLNR